MIEGEIKKTLEENTLYYIQNYLTPNKFWHKNTTLKQKIFQIRYANVNWPTISKHIKNMPYQSFLKTPYWKAIADYTKYKAKYRCQLCNNSYKLVTHHRSYKIHGMEHIYMQELTVLCACCHKKFHNKIANLKNKLFSRIQLILFSLNIFLFFFFLISISQNISEVESLNSKEIIKQEKEVIKQLE